MGQVDYPRKQLEAVDCRVRGLLFFGVLGLVEFGYSSRFLQNPEAIQYC